MAQNRPNSTAFIEAEQYSSFILRNLHDGLLPGTFYRNISDFGSGSQLHIKTLGTVTIQDGAEEVAFEYQPIESGEIFFTITDYVGDAWYVTDDLREDGTQIDQLMAERSSESTRALQEVFETRFLKATAAAHVAGDANKVNGFSHRIVAKDSGGAAHLNLDDLIYMKLAADKANVPMAGRVMIVDPICEASLNKQLAITHDVTPFGEKYLMDGFARDHSFLINLFGWDIITSNRLPKGSYAGEEDRLGAAASVSDGVTNIAMCVLDDQTKPMMGAWRRMPRVEGERNKDLRRDEFVTSSRFGFGAQRTDTLFTYITEASSF